MEKSDYDNLSGVEKVAIVLLSVGEDTAAKIFAMMSEEEVKEVSQVISSLGSVKQEVIDKVLMEFNSQMSNAVSFVGNLETTERLLQKVFDPTKAANIIEDIRGPAGKNTWDKLANINEEILANYLRNEYPQTVALIISKMDPLHAAKVLSTLPEDMAFEVIMRIINMDSVKKEILESVEKTLRAEFIANASKAQKDDTNMIMAEIFNNFDRNNEAKYMGMLESKHPEVAEKIKKLMFTFDDLINVQPAGIQVILKVIDRNVLALALRGASDPVKDLFMSNMSQRAAKILAEEMTALGPVRTKDVDESQTLIINKVKDLAAKGEIIISDNSNKDEFIY